MGFLKKPAQSKTTYKGPDFEDSYVNPDSILYKSENILLASVTKELMEENSTMWDNLQLGEFYDMGTDMPRQKYQNSEYVSQSDYGSCYNVCAEPSIAKVNRNDVNLSARNAIVFAMMSMLAEPSYAINPGMRHHGDKSTSLQKNRMHLKALDDITQNQFKKHQIKSHS